MEIICGCAMTQRTALRVWHWATGTHAKSSLAASHVSLLAGDKKAMLQAVVWVLVTCYAPSAAVSGPLALLYGAARLAWSSYGVATRSWSVACAIHRWAARRKWSQQNPVVAPTQLVTESHPGTLKDNWVVVAQETPRVVLAIGQSTVFGGPAGK